MKAQIALWLALVAAFFLFPGYLVLGSQILIVAILALSLDLILGYAGIVSLGHAAFFGIGAYTAGLLAVHGDRKSTRLNSSHIQKSRMPSSA